jgi:tRNA(adenine34) deaminase
MPPVAAALSGIDLERWMRAALQEAEAAGVAGEYLIGAVVVLDETIIGRGRSRQRERRTQLAHAELEALLDAGERILERHDDAVLFTTVEPCPLCLGAAVMADVPHIVFAHEDPAVESFRIVERVEYVRGHIDVYHGGILRAESRALFERYEPRLIPYLDNQTTRHRRVK